MSSRKEELLSRLKNTLDIVSQAKKFYPCVQEDNESQNVVKKIPTTDATGSIPVEQNAVSLFAGLQSSKVPTAIVDNYQPVGERTKTFDFSHGGGVGESHWNVRTNSASQRNLMHVNALSSIGHIDSIEDEDEFLYGSSSSNESNRTLGANALLSYLPKGRPQSNVKTAVCSSLASYPQQTSGQAPEKELRYTGINSDVLQNVLRMVTKQSPTIHPDLSDNKLMVDPALKCGYQAGNIPDRNWTPAKVQNPVSSKESLHVLSTMSQPLQSVQPPSMFWTDLKMATASFCDQTEHKETESRSVNPADKANQPTPEENSMLSSTLDKILQTMNLDSLSASDLRRLMEEKFKKENEKVIKDEEEKQRLALAKRQMEEEKAKEVEEHKKQLLEEQHRLMAERLIMNLLKAREGKEGLLATSVLDLFTETAGKDLKEASNTLLGSNKLPCDISDRNELYAADESLPDKKIYPISTAKSSNQQSKPDETETRLIVTSGNLLKPEIDSAKHFSKSRNSIDSAWEQSTEEFLRKLQNREENKMEEKRARTVTEESGISRLSRGRSQGDSKSHRLSEIKSHSSKGSTDEAEVRDQNSCDTNLGKVIENNSARQSKSPVLKKTSFPEISHNRQTLALTADSELKKIDVTKGTKANLPEVLENKSERTKEEMKADIEALQAELANLQKFHSGLVGKELANTGQVLKGTTQSTVSSSIKPTVIGNSTAVDPVLSTEQVIKLKVNQMEMIANIDVLQLELENLRRLENGLLQRPNSHQRNLMLEDNKRMQEEVQDQLWAVKQATQELVEQILLQEKGRQHVAQNLAPSVAVTCSALSIAPESKMLMSKDSGSVPSKVSDTKMSAPASNSPTEVSTAVPALQKLLASESKEQSVKSGDEKKSATEKESKNLRRKSSSRSSSSSSSSSSHSSSSGTSSSGSRSRSRSRGRRRSSNASRDTKQKSGLVRNRKSRDRSNSRGKSRSHERYKRETLWPNSRNRNVGYWNRARPDWHSRQTGSSGHTRYDDKVKSGKYDRSRSPSRRRERRSRSRSLTNKKSKNDKSSKQVLEARSPKNLDRNNEVRDSKVKDSKEPDLKQVVDKKTDNKPDFDSSTKEVIKNTDNRLGGLEAQVDNRSLDEKRKHALELAINMYIRAEDYYDGGNIWCRKCDLVFPDMSLLCHHLHSDHHQLVLDPNYGKPNVSAGPKLPSQTASISSAPARGDEFLMPLEAFFCSLCCEFSQDNVHAETHLKSVSHNNKFKQFLKENPSYEFQYLMDKMNALLRSAAMASLNEPTKRPASDETAQESEVKRIKITPLTQETKQPLVPNNAEKIQIKVFSGSQSKVVSPVIKISEEKRVVLCDRKISLSQSSALNRNPSPPGQVANAKAAKKLPSTESPVLSFKRQVNQVAVNDEKNTSTSNLQDKASFDIWSSPNKSKTLPSEGVVKSTEPSVKSDKKFESRPDAVVKKSTVDLTASGLKFQLNTRKRSSMRTGAGKPSFNFNDFEVFDECD